MIDPRYLRRPPIRGRYWATSKMLYLYLAGWDLLLSLLFRLGLIRQETTVPPPLRNPQRILVSLSGHIGDIVSKTAILPALKSAFPAAKIGCVVGSWGATFISAHPMVEWVHVVDHWFFIRGGSLVSRVVRHFATRRQALKELRRVQYDVCIDTGGIDNIADIAFRAGIPIRVGWTSGGFGALLTHPVERHYLPGKHRTGYLAKLLEVLGLETEHIDKMRPVLWTARLHEAKTVRSLLDRSGFVPGRYTVVHCSAGLTAREWPLSKWQDLVKRLIAQGHKVVLVGQGPREMARNEWIAEQTRSDQLLNLCGRLNLLELVEVVRESQMVLCNESMVGHVAAALDVPGVAIYSGADPSYWRPHSERFKVVTSKVPCSPCFTHCRDMECVKEVQVEEVLAAITSLLDIQSSR